MEGERRMRRPWDNPDYVPRCGSCGKEFDEDNETEQDSCPCCGFSGRNKCAFCDLVITASDYKKHPDLCGKCRRDEETMADSETGVDDCV